jgi:cephalosporin hydroxylase
MTCFAYEYEQRCLEWTDICDWLPVLYQEVADRTEPQVIELGVRAGNSTAAFLAAIEKVGGHLWSVDPMPMMVPPAWFEAPFWTPRRADDLRIVDELPNDVDIVFVDTLHTYDQTLAELIAYVPKVKPGGVVLLHDTELPHPEADPTCAAFPVRRAIEHYLTGKPWECEFRSGCYGLGVIRMVEVTSDDVPVA